MYNPLMHFTIFELFQALIDNYKTRSKNGNENTYSLSLKVTKPVYNFAFVFVL